MIILHALTKTLWNTYQDKDFYGELSLEKFGFIHCSDINTYHLVAPNFKNEPDEMVLLVIDTNKVSSKIAWEDLRNTGVAFPHIYGLLNKDAIVTVLPHLWSDNKEWIANDELNIPKFATKELINKGYSKDKKYLVTDEQGNKFLLRISPFELYEKKKKQFEIMKQVASLGVPMCKPICYGICNEGVYSVQSWIDGIDAEENAHKLTNDEQYLYGFEAGRILKEIHKIPVPDGIENWESYFNRKADRKIKLYEECPIKYENGQAFIDYIDSHRHLLRNRPLTYQHGDYHIGNMMIGKDKNLYIIDFDRDDFGDPWEEFNRIVWCAQSTPIFATGMVNGYFNNNVPSEFWELLALYISSNTLASVPWAIPFGEDKVNVMINQAKDVLSWYDNMKNPTPTWYKGVMNIHKIFGTKEDASYLDREGAYIIPIKDDKIGVIKTPKGYFLLGGGIDKGESHEDAIRRECLEEAGCTVNINQKLCSAETYTKHPNIGYFHPIQTYYIGELLEKVQEPIESDHEFMWVEYEQLKGKMFAEMQNWAIETAKTFFK